VRYDFIVTGGGLVGATLARAGKALRLALGRLP
jgi:L-2-hydroxyglutarate oxidase LhgO